MLFVVPSSPCSCVEMLINEQIRRYNEKMEEIEQLEYAEELAVNQLKLKRQNTVRTLDHLCSILCGLVSIATTSSFRLLLSLMIGRKGKKLII